MIEIEILFSPNAFPTLEQSLPKLLQEFDLEVLPTIETRGRQPIAMASIRKVLGLKKRDMKIVKSILRVLITTLSAVGGVSIVINVKEFNTKVKIENTINITIDGNVIVQDSTDIEEVKKKLSE